MARTTVARMTVTRMTVVVAEERRRRGPAGGADLPSLVDGWPPREVRMSWQALVAQRIRASDYGSEGREFESLQARPTTNRPQGRFFCGRAAAAALGCCCCGGAASTGAGPGPFCQGRSALRNPVGPCASALQLPPPPERSPGVLSRHGPGPRGSRPACAAEPTAPIHRGGRPGHGSTRDCWTGARGLPQGGQPVSRRAG